MNASRIREQAPYWTLTALSVLFGLQMIRVFYGTLVYYLRDSQGMSAISLAPIALGVFALSFLAAPLWKIAGTKTSLVITAGGIALIRIVEQIVTDAAIDLILVSIGIVLFTWFLPIALGAQRTKGVEGTANFGYGLLLGLVIDTAIFASVRTLDLSWHDGVLAILIIILLAAAAIVALVRALSQVDPDTPTDKTWSRVFSLAALGPWLFLQLVIFQNVARVSAITGWSLPLASFFIVAFNVVALVAAAHAGRSNRSSYFPTIIGLAYLFLLLFISADGLIGALFNAAGQVLSASLLMIILLGLGERAESGGSIGVVVANGVGQLLLVILSFVFYVSYDISMGFRAELILPIAGFLVSLAAVGGAPLISKGEEPAPDLAPALVAALFLIIPLVMLLTWNTPQTVDPPGDELTVRVMSYNLHNGFNTDGRLDMEALAQVIEENDADVIGLQEVSRGWVINGSVDMLQWLSHRLDMPYIEGPSEGLIWGNAVLSRYPIISSETIALPPDSLLLRRAYTAAEIDIGGETMLFIDTHLHQLEDDSQIRQEQIPSLIEAWNDAPRTVMVGDLNATPDSPEMQMLADAGLVDISAVIGPTPRYTFYSADPDQQIDYIWTSDDWKPIEFAIPQTTASDHLPLVAVLSLPKQGR